MSDALRRRTRDPAAALDVAALRRAVTTLARRDADLRRVVEAYGPPPLWARRPGFATLLRIILEQQVSLASAASAYRRLQLALGRVTPRRFMTLSDGALHQVGFSRQKTAYGRALAEAVTSGRLDLRGLSAEPDDRVTAELTRLPGIGGWTAGIYLQKGF